jgi:glycosyltransferase involved in cell wall biosynthesis
MYGLDVIMKDVLILIDGDEFDELDASLSREEHTLDSSTSVSRLKRDFFQCLSTIGRVHRFNSRCESEMKDVRRALSLPSVICASFHENPPKTYCRLLQHTKGGLMLPGGFLGGWTFREATISLVETERQRAQLNSALGSSAPRLGVFAQRLAEEVFAPRIQTERMSLRAAYNIDPNITHLLFAGRFIANKGIVQLVRALNLWPISGAVLTLIGTFEDNFPISQSDGTHLVFRGFFCREVLDRSDHLRVNIVSAMSQARLSDWYACADVFIYPSFHEDEASGNAPHEAVISGLPSIVTDWCGLGQLGRSTRGGYVRTFATLGGVRYSLAELRESVSRISLLEKNLDTRIADADAAWVREEFNPVRMRESLTETIGSLLELPAGPPPSGGWRCDQRARRLGEIAPSIFNRAVKLAGATPPNGLYVDGGGCGGDSSVSLPHLLHAIQSIYTTWPVPPKICFGVLLRGFWRVSLWAEERAIVEFGFPGPRLLRHNHEAWEAIISSATTGPLGDVEFRPESRRSIDALQRAVDLGYLVPDCLHDDMFIRQSDCII